MYVIVAARSKAWVSGNRLLGLRVRISPGARMPVSCECCVCFQIAVRTADRSLVQRIPTESGVSKCDPETSTMRSRPSMGVEP